MLGLWGQALVDLVCASCGISQEPSESGLEDGQIWACDKCGWVVVWDKDHFRPPTTLEAYMMLGLFPLMVSLGQITLYRQIRVMGADAS